MWEELKNQLSVLCHNWKFKAYSQGWLTWRKMNFLRIKENNYILIRDYSLIKLINVIFYSGGNTIIKF